MTEEKHELEMVNEILEKKIESEQNVNTKLKEKIEELEKKIIKVQRSEVETL